MKMKNLPDCGYIGLENFDFTATIKDGELILSAPWEYPKAHVSFGMHPESSFDHDCNYHVLFASASYTSQGYAKDKLLAEALLNQWGLEISVNLASNDLLAHIDKKLKCKYSNKHQIELKGKLSQLTLSDKIYMEILYIFADFYTSKPALIESSPTDAEKTLLGKAQ